MRIFRFANRTIPPHLGRLVMCLTTYRRVDETVAAFQHPVRHLQGFCSAVGLKHSLRFLPSLESRLARPDQNSLPSKKTSEILLVL
jgi:hypothetical protein